MAPIATIAALLLAGCHQLQPTRARGDTPGDRLEAAAMAAGVVADPVGADPVGLYARENDRMCVVPGEAGGYRIGVLASFDDAQRCTARGTAARVGDQLNIDLGDAGACRFKARFEGDRIVFPAELPLGCDRRCTGRASLAALAVERSSDGMAEAGAQRDLAGRPLCS